MKPWMTPREVRSAGTYLVSAKRDAYPRVREVIWIEGHLCLDSALPLHEMPNSANPDIRFFGPIPRR